MDHSAQILKCTCGSVLGYLDGLNVKDGIIECGRCGQKHKFIGLDKNIIKLVPAKDSD